MSSSIVKSSLTDGLPVRLRELRDDVGLTQPGLARAIGVSTSYINLLESGERPNPTVETVDRICMFFGVTREWLLDGKKPMFVADDEAAADLRYDALLREKFGAQEQREMKEQQIIAQIRVRLAQLWHCDAKQWHEYREQIVAIVDAHAAGVLEHAPELKIARLKALRATVGRRSKS